MYTIGTSEIDAMVDMLGERDGHENTLPVADLASLPSGGAKLLEYPENDYHGREYGIAIRHGSAVIECSIRTEDSLRHHRTRVHALDGSVNQVETDIALCHQALNDLCNQAIAQSDRYIGHGR